MAAQQLLYGPWIRFLAAQTSGDDLGDLGVRIAALATSESEDRGVDVHRTMETAGLRDRGSKPREELGAARVGLVFLCGRDNDRMREHGLVDLDRVEQSLPHLSLGGICAGQQR